MYVIVRLTSKGQVSGVFGQWKRVAEAQDWANKNLAGDIVEIHPVVVPKSVAERKDS